MKRGMSGGKSKYKVPHFNRIHGLKHYFWAGLRIAVGLIFIWAFFDKLLGLGFTTCFNSEISKIDFMCKGAWISGGSPTSGFLEFGTRGPLAFLYQSLAGSAMIDWLFMIGLLGIGITLTFGFLVRLGSLSGVLLMILMYGAAFPPEHHPFIDEHIIYAIIMLGFTFVHTCKHLGLGKWWNHFDIVKKNWILE